MFCSICVEYFYFFDNCNKIIGNGEIVMYGLGKKFGMIGDYFGFVKYLFFIKIYKWLFFVFELLIYF